jgi:hypothetical protein
MNRMFELLLLEDDKIDLYIDARLSELNISDDYEEITLSDDGGNIHPNWINTNTTYLPSGNRPKGFKIDKQFIKDFIIDTKEKFGKIPLDRLKERLNENTIINWFNMYVINYFGSQYDDKKRKEIYGYGLLNSIGENIDVSSLKGLDVARCIEKSATLNQILNFLDIDSSLVVSEANNVGHAYCLVNTEEKNIVVDPNFYGTDTNGKGIPYIFEIDKQDNSFSFDPSLFGDYDSLKVNYSFPSEKLSGIKR